MGSVGHSNLKYDKQDGLFQLRCGATVLADMDKVAVAFSVLPDGSILRRTHGCPDTVVYWVSDAKNKYTALGLLDIADELCYLVSDRWDVAELNRIITEDDYLATFLAKVGIDPMELKSVRGVVPPSDRQFPALSV